MKSSKRLRRLERTQKAKKQPVLNLVSLMDIFTILVFFLLVNSSSTQTLPSAKLLTLPNSTSNNAAKETLIITITKTDVLVQGYKITTLNDIENNHAALIKPLFDELRFQASKSALPANQAKAITIMGDQNTSYALISKILKTCQKANYRHIAFAANEKASSKS